MNFFRINPNNFEVWLKGIVLKKVSTYFSNESNTTTRILLIFLGICTIGIFAGHCRRFPKGEDQKKKITDQTAPMYSLIGLISTLVSVVGFGKPNSPFFTMLVGLGVSVFGPLLMDKPGLFEWLDKSVPIIVIFMLLCEYFYKEDVKMRYIYFMTLYFFVVAVLTFIFPFVF